MWLARIAQWFEAQLTAYWCLPRYSGRATSSVGTGGGVMVVKPERMVLSWTEEPSTVGPSTMLRWKWSSLFCSMNARAVVALLGSGSTPIPTRPAETSPVCRLTDIPTTVLYRASNRPSGVAATSPTNIPSRAFSLTTRSRHPVAPIAEQEAIAVADGAGAMNRQPRTCRAQRSMRTSPAKTLADG